MMMSGQSVHSLFLSLCLCVAPAFAQTRLRPPEIGKPVGQEFSSLLPIAATLRPFGRSLDLSQQSAQEATRRPDAAGDEKDVRPHEKGTPIKGEMSGGQRHVYRLRMNPDQFLMVIVEQQGIDVVVQISGPDGEQILEFDSEKRPRGQEQASLATEAAGDYQLIVRPRQKSAVAGNYEIRIEELRVATDKDRALHKAHRLFGEAIKLRLAGKYDEALPPAQHALEIREQVLGPDHREVAAALHGLASIYASKGEFAKAEPLYQRALLIRENALGPDHPDVAIPLYSLANFYQDKGDYASSSPLSQRALEIWERALGPEHPNVAAALNTLALLHSARGKDMIIRGGENIYPAEIEAFLMRHPKIAGAQVVGAPDEFMGEEVCALIQARLGDEITADEVREYCRAGISRHKVPKFVRFVESFPLTASGKVKKFELREQLIKEMGLENVAGVKTA
jgi:tetratricopeptide (TPR) repeat protein